MRPTLQTLSMIAMAVAMAGCAMQPPSPKSPAPQGSAGVQTGGAPSPANRPQQRCDANPAQWAIGKTNTEHNVEEARKRSGAYMVRVLRPGQPTTREFNAERLNLEVDATGRIMVARCG